jgi:hypothetical protein
MYLPAPPHILTKACSIADHMNNENIQNTKTNAKETGRR